MNAQIWKCAAKISYVRRKLAERQLAERDGEHYGDHITAYILQLIQLQRERDELRARVAELMTTLNEINQVSDYFEEPADGANALACIVEVALEHARGAYGIETGTERGFYEDKI